MIAAPVPGFEKLIYSLNIKNLKIIEPSVSYVICMICHLAFMQNACIFQVSTQPMKPMNPEKLELLITREMPFGKYKGRIIADLPGPYLNWFAREGFPHGELGGLLALMQEIDHNGLSELLEPLRAKHGKPAPRH